MSKPVKNKIKTICSFCKKEFLDWISNKRQFCSRKCWYKNKSRLLGEKAPNWKNAKTPHNGGYNIIIRNGKVYLEHRWVMGQHLGRELLPTEHIHHSNGDKKNNNISNLELLTDYQHKRIHMLGNQRARRK